MSIWAMRRLAAANSSTGNLGPSGRLNFIPNWGSGLAGGIFIVQLVMRTFSFYGLAAVLF
jgi:hypothetical protein